ncbi:glutamate synthase subunit beta [Melioribacteraceae bacterium 4301-Me]|uniref:glutamate synthase subunit beta n=1 Tax=Pyranulibacter aquaticus TaxID=3163344 RepID=UPI0035994499
MAKTTGFIEYERKNPSKQPIKERVKYFKEFESLLPENIIVEQAARCMDCAIPYCHSYGCPVNNRIPDWNDMVYKKQWKRALDLLHSTINFPEFTGRVCPAPCEHACTLSINNSPVTIKHIELQIVERGWEEGWIKPELPSQKSGKKIAIIGSGPSGLAAAQQLARAGHEIVVFEKNDRIGGLLRYGIPDFKLEKHIIDRRLEQMKAEGVIFEPSVDVGFDISTRYLQRTFNAIIIAAGSTIPRDLNIPGRDLKGIHFAMEFLTQQNKINAGDQIPLEKIINAKDKNVVVIGGGDTGSDCVGTAIRQGAKKVTQVEILPKPPEKRNPYNPWPMWPQILFTSSSHEEGCERIWAYSATSFVGENNRVKGIRFKQLEWTEPDKYGRRNFKEIPGDEIELKADLVLLAMGFVHVDHSTFVKDLNLETDNRGNIKVDKTYMSSQPGCFATGDSILGASLVVKAINAGRRVASAVNSYLYNS